jgi:hypothetical protein
MTSPEGLRAQANSLRTGDPERIRLLRERLALLPQRQMYKPRFRPDEAREELGRLNRERGAMAALALGAAHLHKMAQEHSPGPEREAICRERDSMLARLAL